MELRMIKPAFKFTPGQWLFIQVPSVSQFQWHPVSWLYPYVPSRNFDTQPLVFHHIRTRRPICFSPYLPSRRLDARPRQRDRGYTSRHRRTYSSRTQR